MEKKYEIIVYGATGFTGQICCKYLRDNYSDLVWAIAGRNGDKLEQIKSDFSLNCDVVVADGGDIVSLRALASQTKVVLSTAGPFARYGSLLVQACVENGAHYTDITGENHWVRGLIDKHHAEAASKGIRIIPSCGYDSVPSDIGAFFIFFQFDKPVSRVDVYHQAQGGASGGTIETIFTMDGLTKEMRDPFVLNPEETVSEEQRQKSKDGFIIEQVDGIEGWSGIGMMAVANTRVVRRSAALMEQNQKSYGTNFTFGEHGLFSTKGMARLASYGSILAFIVIATPLKRLVRRFLLKPGQGPSQETQDQGWFRATFVAYSEDNERKICSMFGSGDPGYKSTGKMVCESALALARSDNLPGGNEYGGVLTSAVGLGNVLIDRLKSAEIEFKVIN
ncbi:MAG: saccharopine dehydrogenase NADP-binding domain-containing protein [SAR86 cluster bacterium]|nr:saccharopine dehydrogenase NADP-binding domain-containing protein [SAR86 cluster bacterium]